jgi:hypothetical protein
MALRTTSPNPRGATRHWAAPRQRLSIALARLWIDPRELRVLAVSSVFARLLDRQPSLLREDTLPGQRLYLVNPRQ